MEIKDITVTFHTSKVRECADFYARYFGAEVWFDAGWYVGVRLPGCAGELSFQDAPLTGRNEACGAATINLKVEDVDGEYGRLKLMGLEFEEQITDHDYGDRAFSVLDPIGNVVYVYADRPVGDKYRDAVK